MRPSIRSCAAASSRELLRPTASTSFTPTRALAAMGRHTQPSHSTTSLHTHASAPRNQPDVPRIPGPTSLGRRTGIIPAAAPLAGYSARLQPARIEEAGRPRGILRLFCTSGLRSPLQGPAPGMAVAAWVWSRMPRLRSEDGPSRSKLRSRNMPSPLFGKSSNSPEPSSSGGSGGRPPRGPSGASALTALIALADKRLFGHLPPLAVLFGLVAVNILVFIAWLYARGNMQRFADPRAYLFMAKNFQSSELNLGEGRWWTVITPCFSHQDAAHLAVNMVSFALTAPPILTLLGPTTFLALYFGAGIASSFVSMAARRWQDRDIPAHNRTPRFSQGASGSFYAILSTFACIQPNAKFLLFFVIPTPAWACVGGLFAWDLYHAIREPNRRIDSAGHIGGLLAGAAFWRFGLRGLRIP